MLDLILAGLGIILGIYLGLTRWISTVRQYQMPAILAIWNLWMDFLIPVLAAWLLGVNVLIAVLIWLVTVSSPLPGLFLTGALVLVVSLILAGNPFTVALMFFVCLFAARMLGFAGFLLWRRGRARQGTWKPMV